MLLSTGCWLFIILLFPISPIQQEQHFATIPLCMAPYPKFSLLLHKRKAQSFEHRKKKNGFSEFGLLGQSLLEFQPSFFHNQILPFTRISFFQSLNRSIICNLNKSQLISLPSISLILTKEDIIKEEEQKLKNQALISNPTQFKKQVQLTKL